jgi:hypothetical protein
VGHGVDQFDDVVLLDIDVADGPVEEFFLGRHDIRISRLAGLLGAGFVNIWIADLAGGAATRVLVAIERNFFAPA